MPETITVSSGDIAIFRSWLEKQPHLPQDVDDPFIGHFISFGKGSMERAKQTFDNYFKVGHCFPEMFRDYDPFSDFNKPLNNQLALCFLPSLSPAGNKIVISKLLEENAASFNIQEYFVRHCTNVQLLLWESDTPYNGVEYIVDCEGTNIGHMRTATPAFAERVMNFMQNSNPIRIKAMHIVGLTPIIEKIFTLFMSFMKEKIRQRVTFHSNMESLHKVVPPKILPKDYEGEGPTVKELHDQHLELLKRYRERFINEGAKRAKEAPLRPKSQDEVMTGTFRQLQVD